MSSEDGIIYICMTVRSLKQILFHADEYCLKPITNAVKKYGFILYSFDEALNMSKDQVATYSKTWIDVINSMVYAWTYIIRWDLKLSTKLLTSFFLKICFCGFLMSS